MRVVSGPIERGAARPAVPAVSRDRSAAMAGALLGLCAGAALLVATGCSNTTCQPIPDGRYAAIGPDGGALTTVADAGASADGGDAGATEVPLIYTFEGGLPVQQNDLPVPYDTAPATCDKPTVTCETAYVCTGYGTAGIVTSYTPGKSLSFSITTPASTTIVNLDPTPLP
jgi:hypothetical protein